MFKRINSKVLGLIFVVLLVFVVLILMTEKKRGNSSAILRETTFDQIDTAKVTKMIIYPKGHKDNFEIAVSTKGWEIHAGDKTFSADMSIVKGLLQELASIKIERIAAKSEESWEKYQVTDSSGIRVIVKEHDKTTADIVIGKFNFQQPTQNSQYQRNQQMKFSTFIRNYDDEMVYLIDGMMSMNFNIDANALRNKSICNINSSDIKKITFSYPADSSFSMINKDGIWSINGVRSDSLKTAQFINTISHLSSSNFIDDINDGFLPKNNYSLKIEGDNFTTIEIGVFPYKANIHVIRSSENTSSYFNGDEAALFEKLFITKNSLTH